MSYFLDTDICIYALKGLYPAIERHLRSLVPAEIKVPSIVKAELYYGAEKGQNPPRTLAAIERLLLPFEIVAFCGRSAESYSRIRSDLEQRGKPIGPNDLIIAATVAANDGVLVTHNIQEFRRIKGLRLADWTR